MQLPPAAVVAEALDAAYSGLTAIVSGLDDLELLLPSGCRGWTIADLLLHVTGDAQGALVALATPTSAPVDVDFVRYWRAFPGAGDPPNHASPGAGEQSTAVAHPSLGARAPSAAVGHPSRGAGARSAAAAHAQWVRRTASAFQRPSGVVKIWSDTAPAAVRAARAADPDGRLATQGRVFAVPDFLAVLVTEAVIHHLDLIDALPAAPEPAPEAAALARATLDGLAAPALLPASWNTRETLLKGTGRTPLTADDRHDLGTQVDRIPLLG